MSGPLLTAREVAELLGVSTGALLRWKRRGTIPSITLPSGQVRFERESLERWLEGRSDGVESSSLHAINGGRG